MKETRFKQTEVGLIPEDWDVSPLVNLFLIGNGRDYKYQKKGSIPVYGTGGIITYIDSFIYDGETVCIGRKGTINRPLYLKGKIWTVDTLYYTYNFHNVCVKFLYYKFLLINWLSYNAASGVPSLTKKTIYEIKISHPKVDEQIRIAFSLSSVENLLFYLDKLIEKKKLIKQGVLQKLLTGEKRLPGFTEKWIEMRLGNISNIYRGGSPRPIEEYITTDEDGINWIKIGDVDNSAKYIYRTQEKIKPSGVSCSRYVKDGDFLLSNSMSFGRPYILRTSGCIHDGWLVIQDYQNNCNCEFLYYMLSSNYVLQQYKSKAAGSSVLNLNKDIVSNVVVKYPKEIDEQKAIVSILSSMDKEIESLETKKAKYAQIKQGMMQQLLTGRIRLI